jgi:type IV pilus assembly protein PilV
MKHKQSGVALLEALIATLILAIGLLGTIGMQARAYSALSDASMRAEATMASEKLLAQMTLDQANLASYAYGGSGTPSAALAGWITDTRSAIPGADLHVTVDAVPATTRSVINITISWLRKSGGQTNKHVVTSYIAPSR